MEVKLDFGLSHRFGVVENTIFRLALNGLKNIRQISSLLWVFSDEVIANAIYKLVNQQILCANLKSQTIEISEPIQAIIEKCAIDTFIIEMPKSLNNNLPDGKLIISDSKTKEIILTNLLPEIKLSFLSTSIDFFMSERGEINE